MQDKFINLSQFGFLKVSGPDAAKLLQGQLTCDVTQLPSFAAHCNPQGRVVSFFYLFCLENQYYLFMPRTMVPVTLAALKKYAVFYKVSLEDASETLECIGSMTVVENAISLPFGKNRFLIIQAKTPDVTNITEWKQLDIAEGIPQVYPETSSTFLPHDINLDQLNAISLNKGCYTGQEIIARMQYRGKLKKRMYRVRMPQNSTLSVGATVDGITIVDVHPHTSEALVIINESKLSHLGDITLLN